MDKMTVKAKGLHDLICDMLRGVHVNNMSRAALAEFTYKAGAALHNTPLNLVNDEKLSTRQLIDINKLDPSGANNKWGDWVKQITIAFDQELTASPSDRN